MPRNDDNGDDEDIAQLRKRVDELTTQLERVSSERVQLQLESDALARSRNALANELEATRAELEQLQEQRPALTFDQLGAQLRQGLVAVDDAGGEGSRYQAKAATFELKAAIDSDGEQVVLRLPGVNQPVDPGLLATVRLELGRAPDADPDLSGLVLVPTVSGASADGAAERLARAGLTVGETTSRAALAPPGTVVDQDPEGGVYVEPGTAIDLVMAAGEVTVPDVLTLARDVAIQRLAAVRLEVGEVTTRPSEGQRGTVIDQDPEPGASAAVGSSVDLVVAGPVKREVPDLSGRTVDEADRLLGEAELKLGPVTERIGGGPPGTIVAQSPAAGTLVNRGRAVAVTVARAPVPRARPVPNVVGLPRPKAVEVLAEADFTGEVIGTRPFPNDADPDRFDTVVEQEPAAGTLSTEPLVGLVVLASGASVETLRGIGPAMTRRLVAAGLRTVGDVAHADPERIAEAAGFSLVRATAVRDDAIERNRPR